MSQQDSLIWYTEQGSQIASFFPFDPQMTHLVKKGVDEFSSLIAHRLLRWQIRLGFENWILNKKDPRLIVTKGGYAKIASLIGCGSGHKASTTVKALLYAQAYARFKFGNGSQGNIILLRELECLRNGEPSQIHIILGEFFLPQFVHNLRKGEERRLIPIPPMPPLLGSKNTHKSQALFQLLVFEQFSDQSIDLFAKGTLYLPFDKWIELANAAKLPIKLLPKVIQAWVDHKLIIKIQESHYVMGEGLAKECALLLAQGRQRVHGRKRRNAR